MPASRLATDRGQGQAGRKFVNDLVKRVGRSLKLLREQGLTKSAYFPQEGLMWELVR